MKGLLKFMTCGSVDDGKSTLIGHMLYDAKLLFADQKRALELESKARHSDGGLDYSLLLDGLMAEREQGITIDVAYRYFATERRSFIVADTPGHEEYTRNMAVGASFADLAVILVDATKGVLSQTRRHARICALMGIQYFAFVINKMDLVRYDETTYQKIEKDIYKLAIDLEFENVRCFPISATTGENVTLPSRNMPWYGDSSEKTLLFYLETVEIKNDERHAGFIMPIQRVCRPNSEFRGFQGEIVSGEVAVGDEVEILPSKEKARIKKIFITDRQAGKTTKRQAVTVQLDKEIDVSRGSVIVQDAETEVSDLFSGSLLWLDDVPLVRGKSFWLKLGTCVIPASVMSIKYKIDINSGEHIAASELFKNEIGVCEIMLSGKIVCAPFHICRELGEFILIDRVSHMTSACGVLQHTMRRSVNLSWQDLDITREMRAKNMGQRPFTIWFTGLSGAGKSTLANEVEKRLSISGKHTMLLDGDNIRMGLNRDLGFTEADRIENIRRIAEVAKLLNDAGIIVLTSFISPYRSDRERARDIIGGDNFVEIYVSTPIEECEKRDVKGLYRKAREGLIPNFTGISSSYEPPNNPNIVLNTADQSMEESASIIMRGISTYLS